MKAIQISVYGGPEVLQLVDIPKPIPGPGQILVHNKFTGVNFIDTYHRTGLYKVPLPLVIGREAAGIVESVGEGVTGYKVGDHIAYLGPNTYAEYTLASPGSATVLPENVPLDLAAAVLLQGMTVVSLAKISHEVKPTETVLIQAAAGGTGLLLVQYCKSIGATVIGTVSTPEKAERARKAGADHIILYSSEDVQKEVMRITNGKGVNAVFDGVGKSTFDISLSCLARLGSMISFGNASGKVEPFDMFKLTPKAIRLMRPSLMTFYENKEEFDALAAPIFDLISRNKLTVHVHKLYDLKDAAQAHTDLESRGTEGKLVIKL
ncbi:hypothetical protein BJ742DRAFT_897385 [Cladochytrium replicatum]|nr:hypothetical protein BJ742DRAFT_897385 [Cladochytrium replicatum]